MSNYRIGITKPSRKWYEGLVALPLVLVTIFCFVFVALHPYSADKTTATNSDIARRKSKSFPNSLIVNITPLLTHIHTVPEQAVNPSVASLNNSSLAQSTASLSNQQVPPNPNNTSAQVAANSKIKSVTQGINQLRSKSINIPIFKNIVK